MNNIKTIKICLDFILMIVYLLLLNAFGTGLVFHEIAGLVAITLFIVHIYLNRKWFKTNRIWLQTLIKFKFRTKSTKKAVLMRFVNIGLFLCISIVAISGIIISQVIFPAISSTISSRDLNFLVTAHKLASYSCLGLISIHFFLHRKYILNTLRDMYVYGETKLVLALGIGLIIGILFDRNILGLNKRSTYRVNPLTALTQGSGNAFQKSDQTQGNNQNSSATLDDAQGNSQISLSDYLGKMFCMGCDRRCSLLNPSCNRGQAQMQAAKTEYQNLYGQSSSDTSIDDQTQGNNRSDYLPQDHRHKGGRRSHFKA